MSQLGHSRRFDREAATSGPLQRSDIVGSGQDVAKCQEQSSLPRMQ
jgi:hypothetical protein